MKAYNNNKTYSYTKANHSSFTISKESHNNNDKPPSDSHPIQVYQHKFTINANSHLDIQSKHQPTSFNDHCNHLQKWKQQLLTHLVTEYPDSFVTIIQEGTPINITTDGTKSSMKSGGGWIITSSAGKILTHGANPDLGSMKNMHSH